MLVCFRVHNAYGGNYASSALRFLHCEIGLQKDSRVTCADGARNCVSVDERMDFMESTLFYQNSQHCAKEVYLEKKFIFKTKKYNIFKINLK